VSSIRALRNLRTNERTQSQSLERLSTGLRINRASDDPAGLIIPEPLRAQLGALDQAVENSQNASNLISTADAALGEIQTILSDIKDSLVFAQNTGGSSPEQIAAEQDAVDNSIAAIDRIASTTRYADRALLNGTSGFSTTTGLTAGLDNLQIRQVAFSSGQDTRTLDFELTVQATRGEQIMTGATTTGASVMRISGSLGTEDVNLASGASAADIGDAINAVAGFTGVYAEVAGGNVTVRTNEFGESALLQLEVISGDITGIGTGAAGQKVSDRGSDGEIEFEGQNFVGDGNHFSILSRVANVEFDIASGTALGTLSAGVRNTGLVFQLNEAPRQTDRLSVGIASVSTASLGIAEFTDQILTAATGTTTTSGGFLNSLVTGGDNDLVSNPENASLIVDESIKQIGVLRGFLGAIQASSIEPNVSALEVEIENLSASLSDLRDLDFAAETAQFTKSQILFQAGTAVLASANLVPQSVLSLLA
jgi:flagellin